MLKSLYVYVNKLIFNYYLSFCLTRLQLIKTVAQRTSRKLTECLQSSQRLFIRFYTGLECSIVCVLFYYIIIIVINVSVSENLSTQSRVQSGLICARKLAVY